MLCEQLTDLFPKAEEAVVSPPSRPWTPSYSVHSQGSPRIPAVATNSEVPEAALSTQEQETEVEAIEPTSVEHEAPIARSAPAEAPAQEEVKASSVEAVEVPEVEEKPIVPEVVETPVSEAQEQIPPMGDIIAPVPLISPTPVPGSWVPSYSVSRQGSRQGSPLPKAPEVEAPAVPEVEAAVVPQPDGPSPSETAGKFWDKVDAVEKEAEVTVTGTFLDNCLLRILSWFQQNQLAPLPNRLR